MTFYYVGIDGGGTSCRARIRDSKGHLIGEGKSGSANILLGAQAALDAIIQAVDKASIQGGLNRSEFAKMHLGLALAGAEQQSAWYEFISLPHPFASVTLNTDAYGACLGAHEGKDGAILIAGTGSCGIYICNGEQFVVGGREFPISDQGSGAIMGLRLIQEVILASDGIRTLTPLASYVLEYFDNNIDNIVLWSKSAKPRNYGQFAPKIFEFADKGDELAIKLLRQTTDDIEMYLMALNKKGATKIALMGGIAERIKAWLSPPVQDWIIAPMFDAVEGALMFAGKPEHNLYTLPTGEKA